MFEIIHVVLFLDGFGGIDIFFESDNTLEIKYWHIYFEITCYSNIVSENTQYSYYLRKFDIM